MKLQSKHLIYVAIVLLVAAVTFQSYRLSVKVNELRNSDASTALLKEEIKHKVDSIQTLKDQRLIFAVRAGLLYVDIDSIRHAKWVQKLQLDTLLTMVSMMPKDSAYKYYQKIHMDPGGVKEYPITYKQLIASIEDHVTVESQRKYIVTQDNLVNKQAYLIILKDDIIKNLDTQVGVYSSMSQNCMALVDIKTNENKQLDKEVKKEKRWKSLFQGVMLAQTLYILITLL
jgi:hypothetical protein